MRSLSRATKLKLLIPISYFIATLLYFFISWPSGLELHHVAGAIITVIAFIFWIIARVQLGNAFSIAPKSKFLVRSGLYSKLRHPVYYFSILAVLGLCIYLWNPVTMIPLGLLVAFEIFRINKEETKLTDDFGSEYSRYKQSTWF